MLNQDRREFIGKSLLLGTAGLLTSSLAGIAHAQTLGPMRRSNRYEDSFIFERKPYSWPNNKSLAIWIAPNVEVWHYDSSVGTGVSPNPSNRVPDVIKRPLIMFGRAPFAFYVAHLYLIHTLAVAFGVAQGFDAREFLTYSFFFPKGYGVGLPGVYVVWLLVVATLYPLCKWASAVKARRQDWWLSYL